MFQHLTVSLSESNETVGAEVMDKAILPYLHGAVGFDITRDVAIQVAVDGLSLSSDWMLDAGVYLNYQFSDRWDATAGWQHYARDIETDEITNRMRYDMPHLAIAHSW